jgi:hypothetical protein
MSQNTDKENQIYTFAKTHSSAETRKEIGRIFGLKKSARNRKFNQMFGSISWEGGERNGERVVNLRGVVNDATESVSAFGQALGDVARGKKPKVEVKGDKAAIEVKNSKAIYTLEELIKVSGIDMNEWSVSRFTANSYGDNFQAKAEFVRKKENSLKQILEEFRDDALNYAPNVDKIPHPEVVNGKLLVINLADAHIGKLCNKEQAGHNYDLKIAKEVYLRTLNDLIGKAKKQGGIETIWYIVGNDYLTIDTPQNTTTRGTPQDVDTRFSKIFREGRKLLIDTVEILKQVAPVHIIVVPGNHDRSSMFHLGDALECWYHNDENVTVDNDDKLRKYYSYGFNAFSITHGDGIKPEKLIQVPLYEYGPEWGAAKRRYVFCGHFHHYKVHNMQGTEIWTFPSVSGSDDFHQLNGYVGSTRQAIAMVFSDDNLDAVFYSQPIEDKDHQ